MINIIIKISYYTIISNSSGEVMGKKKHSSKRKNSSRDKHSSMNQGYNNNPIIPPCSKFLGNDIPFLNDYSFIYNNQNRIFCFLVTTPFDKASLKTTLHTNLQISLKNFIIGYYISKVQKNIAYYNKNVEIDSNKNVNKLIHELLNISSKVKLPCPTFLSLQVSNGNAIQPLINFADDITSINYIIIFLIHSIESNPALYYGNNSYITNNVINQILSSQNISLPIDQLKL